MKRLFLALLLPAALLFAASTASAGDGDAGAACSITNSPAGNALIVPRTVWPRSPPPRASSTPARPTAERPEDVRPVAGGRAVRLRLRQARQRARLARGRRAVERGGLVRPGQGRRADHDHRADLDRPERGLLARHVEGRPLRLVANAASASVSTFSVSPKGELAFLGATTIPGMTPLDLRARDPLSRARAAACTGRHTVLNSSVAVRGSRRWPSPTTTTTHGSSSI